MVGGLGLACSLWCERRVSLVFAFLICNWPGYMGDDKLWQELSELRCHFSSCVVWWPHAEVAAGALVLLGCGGSMTTYGAFASGQDF